MHAAIFLFIIQVEHCVMNLRDFVIFFCDSELEKQSVLHIVNCNNWMYLICRKIVKLGWLYKNKMCGDH